MLCELLSEQAEFSRHLFREGYPLWSPDPARLPHERDRDGMRIGDLGIVDEDGHFRLLFNVCEIPQDDLLNSPTGSPLIQESDIESSFQKLPHRCVIASPQTTWSVDPEHDSNAHRNQPRRTLYQAELTADGTHIILPHGADKYELSPSARSRFEDLARRHGREWHARAREVFMLESEPLYLITGFYKACSWALASLQIRTDSQIRVRCNVVERGVRHILRDESLWNPTGRFQHKIGPGPENEGRKNQSVFISGFVITPRQLVSEEEPAAVGLSAAIPFYSWFSNKPTKDTAEPGTTEGQEIEVSIDQIPRIQQRTFHPGEIMNRYLLAKEPSAEVAVTHDTVWTKLVATGKLSTIEDLERFLEQRVSEDYSINVMNGAVCLNDKGVHTSPPPSPSTIPVLNGPLEGDQYSSSSAIPLRIYLTAPPASKPSTPEESTLTVPKSRPPSSAGRASLHAQVEAQQAVEAGDIHDAPNLQYILSRPSEGSIRSFGSELSFVLGNPLSTSGLSIAPGSSLTLPIEDPYVKHLQEHDRGLNAQRSHWSFVLEKADTLISSGPSRRSHAERSQGANPTKPIEEISLKVQEIWQCEHLGRFKVDRPIIKPRSADPIKAPQQRIYVCNVANSDVKARTTSGPHSVIHKHSRAVAFSICRSHDLFSDRKPDGDTQAHVNMRHSILLAPKKVQEQYMSKKTTIEFNTHGLLDDESQSYRDKDKDRDKVRRGRGSQRGIQGLSFREKEWRRTQDAENARGKRKASSKGKDESDKKYRGNSSERAELSTDTSSTGSVGYHTLHQAVSAPELPAMEVQFSPRMSFSTTAFNRKSTSHPVSPTLSLPPSYIGDPFVKVAERGTASIPPISHHRDPRESLDSNDCLPTRTPHAEAFGTLDPNDIEHYRVKVNNHATTAGVGKRLLQAFRSRLRLDGPSSSMSSQPGAYRPPWIVTSGRDQQEEHGLVLDDLNDSFGDIGFLPTNPYKASRRYAKRKTKDGILSRIPDDALYMLLPLWAGDKDTTSVHAESISSAPYLMPEKRHYLLVYYVPYNGATDPQGKKVENKKAKQSHSSDSGVESDLRAIYLPSFHVFARVITYKDLRFSGVYLPSSGLAVNGPEGETISYSVSTPQQKMLATPVCLCEGRERGFDFSEDGLHNLGLCARKDLPIQNASISEDEEWEGNMVPTPIGRAVIEMIWLGCLAVTSFGPSQP